MENNGKITGNFQEIIMRVLVGSNSFNGAQRWEKLFWSIRNVDCGHSNYELLAVDDGTPGGQGSNMMAVGQKYGAACLRFQNNKGIAAGWNAIGNYAFHNNFDAFMIVNDDVIVTDDWLRTFVYFLEHNPHVKGCVSYNQWFFRGEEFYGSELNTPAKRMHPGTRENQNDLPIYSDRPGRVMCAPGMAFGMSIDTFIMIGGFDEKNFNTFFEESDFGTRLAMAGHASWVLPYPQVYHAWSDTFKHNPNLDAGKRADESRLNYIQKYRIPDEGQYHQHPFSYTDPKYYGPLPSVDVEYLYKDIDGDGILKEGRCLV